MSLVKPSQNIAQFLYSAASTDSFFDGAFNSVNVRYDPLITGYAYILWLKIPS